MSSLLYKIIDERGKFVNDEVHLVILLMSLMCDGVRAAFVLLDPDNYREGFVEGWPGPYSNGTGAGKVRHTSHLD